MPLKARLVCCKVVRVAIRLESSLRGISEAAVYFEIGIHGATITRIKSQRKVKTKAADALAGRYGDEVYFNRKD